MAFFERKDNFPTISSTFTGDNTAFKFFGPVSGRRYEISATYSPDLKAHGTLSADYTMDWREYYQLSSRTLLAARVFGGYSSGNLSNLYYFGGLNTLRGFEFRSRDARNGDHGGGGDLFRPHGTEGRCTPGADRHIPNLFKSPRIET